MCADFYRRCCSTDRQLKDDKGNVLRTLVARVGTGEGKSLIIAMLAVYLAKFKRQKVHILVNNEGLRARDYNSMKDFYGAFDLTCAKSNKSDRGLAPQAAPAASSKGDARQQAFDALDEDTKARLEANDAGEGDVRIVLTWDNSTGAAL